MHPFVCRICKCKIKSLHTSSTFFEKSLYEILKVSPTASQKQIKNSYFKLSKLHHPDKSGKSDDKIFLEISSAYKILSNVEEKEEYDRSIRIKANHNRFKTGEYDIFNNPSHPDLHRQSRTHAAKPPKNKKAEDSDSTSLDPKVARLLGYVYAFIVIFFASAFYIKFLKNPKLDEEDS